MSQNGSVSMGATGNAWSKIVETIAGTWLQKEHIKAGIPLGYGGAPNSYGAYPLVQTGVDYDGRTLIGGQWVPGVSNASAVAGLGGLIALGIVAYALTR